jgi:hypothetical protein
VAVAKPYRRDPLLAKEVSNRLHGSHITLDSLYRPLAGLPWRNRRTALMLRSATKHSYHLGSIVKLLTGVRESPHLSGGWLDGRRCRRRKRGVHHLRRQLNARLRGGANRTICRGSGSVSPSIGCVLPAQHIRSPAFGISLLLSSRPVQISEVTVAFPIVGGDVMLAGANVVTNPVHDWLMKRWHGVRS